VSNGSNVTYCIDSSSIIYAWTDGYRPAFAKTFWASLSSDVDARTVISPDEVKREISARDDGLKAWARDHSHVFVAIDEEQQELVRKILRDHPYVAKKHKKAHHADPWVIALASQVGAVVVTQENYGSPAKPGIPRVCEGMNVPYMNLADMIEARGWEF
jgi:hypothetical protein